MAKRSVPSSNSWSSGLAGVFLVVALLWQYGPGIWVLCGASASWVSRWHHAVAMLGFVLFFGVLGWAWRGRTKHVYSNLKR